MDAADVARQEGRHGRSRCILNLFVYTAWRQRTGLPDAHSMLTMAGIDPHGPHEIDVMRLKKAMKKADGRAVSGFPTATTKMPQIPGIGQQTLAHDLDDRSGKP